MRAKSESQHESWGRYPDPRSPVRVERPTWLHEIPDLRRLEETVLPYGKGRSYGDVCLNAGGILLDTSGLSRFVGFDAEKGLLRCEAGVSFRKILDLVVPHGWFLPVTPGTKYVTVGGAIANDIHGKNHHQAGTFGRHVTRFELLRSSGERFVCSPKENEQLYRATIGGMGLTGLITWAEFQLKPIPGPGITMDALRFGSLEEFFVLSEESRTEYDYTVAWVDGLATGKNLGRGLYMRGNSSPLPSGNATSTPSWRPRIPIDAPQRLLNPFTVRAFNTIYYWARPAEARSKLVHYEPFFYPLDGIEDWNRLYGESGFLQHQCVVPFEGGRRALRVILRRVAEAGSASPLAVLKRFGSLKSPGILSFPQPGYTLALDFPTGPETLHLLDELDTIVREVGGAVYPAKDARMAAADFRMFFPEWEVFSKQTDPGFSSNLWRRVTREAAPDAPLN